jgi:polygalacturonase
MAIDALFEGTHHGILNLMTGKFILSLGLIVASFASPAANQVTYNVHAYGAMGDGSTHDTAALQQALDACATNGGGRVLLPAGVYLTGSVVIGPNTTLELEHNASIVGSPEVADYPLVQIRWEGEFREGHRALLSAEKADHVSIIGPGAIFGPPINLGRLRNPRGPALIEFTECTNTLLENFATQYEQLWSIHLLFCQGLIARGLTIRSINVNGDGVDVDSCRDLIIEHCTIDTGDDAISLKSGRGLAAQQLGRPTENVTIRDCSLTSSIYAAIGIGTEMSGGIRNVHLENDILCGRQNAIFIKSRDGRGGYITDITGANLIVNNSPTFIGIDLIKKGIQATDPVPGEVEQWALVKNITFKNIQLNHIAELVAGKGVPLQRPLDGLTLTDITGTCARGISLANMTNVTLAGIKVTGVTGPLVSVENVQGTGLEQAAVK